MLKQYAEVSKEAEHKRSTALDPRENRFQRAEHRFKEQFETSLKYFATHFEGRESSRDQGHRYRQHKQSSLLSLFDTILDQLLSSFLTSVSNTTDIERDFMATIKTHRHLSKVLHEMERIVHHTRQTLTIFS